MTSNAKTTKISTQQRFDAAVATLVAKGAKDVKFFFEPASLNAAGTPDECTERALNTIEAIANGACIPHPRFMNNFVA